MHQTVLARQDGDKGTEIHQTGDATFVDHADLDVCGDQFDTLACLITGTLVDREDLDRTVVTDVHGRTGFLGDRADGDTTFADDIANLVRVDFERNDAWRMLGHLCTRRVDRLVHLFEDMQPAVLCLFQRDLHDLAGDAIDLDIHLQRVDTVHRAGHLEIHVAEVILVAQDIGQHCKFGAFLDQTHRHPGDR